MFLSKCARDSVLNSAIVCFVLSESHRMPSLVWSTSTVYVRYKTDNNKRNEYMFFQGIRACPMQPERKKHSCSQTILSDKRMMKCKKVC